MISFATLLKQVGHVNQMGQLSKTPLNLLEIHGIGPVDTI